MLVNSLKLKSQKLKHTDSSLPSERAITVYLNNKLLTTFMATPVQIKELVVGFLYSENIIIAPSELTNISVNQNSRKAQVWVESNIKELDLRTRTITSGCGRGLTFLCPSDIEGLKPLNSDTVIEYDGVIKLSKEMIATATLYKQSGGMHSVALCNAEEIISFSEDIGRHNAVDKLIGDALLRGLDLAGKILLTTGRISSEMLLKSFRAKIPLIGSLTSPTDLSVELAEKLGITVIGYIRGNRMKVYSHPARLSQTNFCRNN